MTEPITIYHKPRCSKSRATLALLQDHGRQADVVEYLKAPPTATELNDILHMMGLEPRTAAHEGSRIQEGRAG